MKTVAHAFVVVLALTGAAAATSISVSAHKASSPAMAAKATAFPIPTCPLDDPNSCGMGGPPSVSASNR